MSRLNKHNMAPISSIKVTETVTNEGETRIVTRNITLKFHDKLAALEKLAKITGMYEPPQPPPAQAIDNRTVNNDVVITSHEALVRYRRLMDGATVETATPDSDECLDGLDAQ